MTRRSNFFLSALSLLGLWFSPLQADDPPVRVMSYNIRYGTANDGENHWDRRKDFLVETIAAFAPDLLGTQETLGFQRDYLADHLSGYEAFGVGRDDGAEKGEMTAVFYRRERFEKLDGGHFWLSETPEIPGSKSWDTSLTRMVSWVKLRDLQSPNKPVIWLFNTHFDHRGRQARVESAKLIRKKIEELTDGAPTIVTGDFNASEGSEPYAALYAKDQNGDVTVIDAYRTAHPQRGEVEGTMSGFTNAFPTRGRIDWIAVTPQWTVLSAEIDRTIRDGRTPSDHLPVTATLTLKSTSSATR